MTDFLLRSSSSNYLIQFLIWIDLKKDIFDEVIMIPEQSVEEVKKILLSIYDPLEIYLFGSYAWGIPHDTSDIDIAVIIEEYSKDRHQMLVDG